MESIFNWLLGPLQGFMAEAYGRVKSCEDRMEALSSAMNELKVKLDAVNRKVGDVKRKGKEIKPEVKNWLDQVGELEREVEKMEADFRKRFRCLGDCSPDLWLSYQLSDKALKKHDKAEKLKNQGGFSEVGRDPEPGRCVEMPGGSGFGMDAVFRQLLHYVGDDGVSIIGIYGMGGVGKTELLVKLNNEALRKGDCCRVIWIDTTGLRTVPDIQMALAKDLGLVWEASKGGKEVKNNIFSILKNGNFLLLLDDVWEPFDPRLVGIPIDKGQSKSKIILTTRSEVVCGRMGAKRIRVGSLEWKEAWSLFAESAGGEERIRSDKRIQRFATTLAKKCGGLPPALIAIGRAMSSKEYPEQWKNTITELRKAPWEVPGMKDVLERLKRSYDKVADEKLWTCLSYCSLYPEGFSIYKEWIIDYCIGEGIIARGDQMDEIYNKGHDILGDLKAVSLLERGEDEHSIMMHPMVRAMALYIACEDGTKKNKWVVPTGDDLVEAPGAERWESAQRMSLMRSNICVLPERPNCPDLVTLMLQHNSGLKVIPLGFFGSMPILRVLDLSHTSIEEVPAGIGGLVGLQYLDFANTRIKSLPKELGALLKLRFLLLSLTRNLRTIPHGVIAKLTELEVLYMDASYGDWRVGSGGEGVDFEELAGLKRLKALGITVKSVLALQRLARSYHLAASTGRLHIEGCQGLPSISSNTIGNYIKCLEWLGISWSGMLEEVVIRGGDNDSDEGFLPNLKELILYELRISKSVWDGGRRCLENLHLLCIEDCKEMEQLVYFDDDEEDIEAINGLPHLKEIILIGLPKLERLSSGRSTLAFPSLAILSVQGCPKLKKLTLVAEKLHEIEGYIKSEDGYIKL